MSYLRYLWFFVYSGVQYILCCVLFVFVLCALCCQFLWIVHFDCPFGLLDSLTFIKNDIYMDMKVKLSVKHKKE
jgi:hypothetical protein